MGDRVLSRRCFVLAVLGLGVAGSAGGVVLLDALAPHPAPLPPRIAGLYWTRWNAQISLRQVPAAYSVLYLFAARRHGSPGHVVWGHEGVAADIRFCQARGQRVILTIGGAGQSIDFSSRRITRRLVDSVERIDQELSTSSATRTLDGVDLNTFETAVPPVADEYVWLGLELKRRFGADFVVTSPPSARSDRDQYLCRAVLSEGAMDYVAPQFYDGPGLAEPDYIVAQTDRWVREVAAGDSSRIAVGFGMEQLPYYSTIEEIVSTWKRVEREHPRIRGAFLWQHETDAARNWAFARQAAPLINRVTGDS